MLPMVISVNLAKGAIAMVKKNLQWYDKSNVGVVVKAHELYNEFVKY